VNDINVDSIVLEKGKTFDALDDNGNEVECEIVMSYICDLNNRAYVIYTDNIMDENNNLNLYASRYIGNEEGQLILEDIEDSQEWILLDDALKKAKEGLND